MAAAPLIPPPKARMPLFLRISPMLGLGLSPAEGTAAAAMVWLGGVLCWGSGWVGERFVGGGWVGGDGQGTRATHGKTHGHVVGFVGRRRVEGAMGRRLRGWVNQASQRRRRPPWEGCSDSACIPERPTQRHTHVERRGGRKSQAAGRPHASPCPVQCKESVEGWGGAARGPRQRGEEGTPAGCVSRPWLIGGLGLQNARHRVFLRPPLV